MNYKTTPMKKAKLIFPFLLLMLFNFTALAQPPMKGDIDPQKREQIENMKIAFITKKVNLTSAEAQAFWPVYNEFHNKLDELRKSKRQIFREGKEDVSNMTDAEVEALMQQHFDFRMKELELQKEYHGKFKSVLPVKKVAALYSAEEEFKRELIKKIRDRK